MGRNQKKEKEETKQVPKLPTHMDVLKNKNPTVPKSEPIHTPAHNETEKEEDMECEEEIENPNPYSEEGKPENPFVIPVEKEDHDPESMANIGLIDRKQGNDRKAENSNGNNSLFSIKVSNNDQK